MQVEHHQHGAGKVRAARRTTGTPCVHDPFAGGAATKRRTRACEPVSGAPGQGEEVSWWSSVTALVALASSADRL